MMVYMNAVSHNTVKTCYLAVNQLLTVRLTFPVGHKRSYAQWSVMSSFSVLIYGWWAESHTDPT